MYCVFQWKDELDSSEPWWKKLIFWMVYRPFNQFCRHRLKIPSYNGEDKDGRLWWLEFQGATHEKWEALQACKSRNWGYEGLAFDELLPETTTVECADFNYPQTDEKTQEKYRKNGKPTIEVGKLDLVKLASKIAQSDKMVEHFQSKAT